LLLKSGANPNTPIATGETPLMTCARTGNVDAVKLLVEFGANVNTAEPTQGQNALMWAIAERHFAVVQALIAAHADLKAASKQGFTPIHFAARVGDLDSLKALIAAGVDIDYPTQGGAAAGYTPLLVASLRAKIDTALYLLDHGANPNADAPGFTPLHWASTSWEGYASNPVYGFEDPMSGIPDRCDL
jgi:ankyrin repeat protein